LITARFAQKPNLGHTDCYLSKISNPVARRWLLRLHLTGGLALGLYAVLLGGSGAILVFREELTALAYPELRGSAAGSATVAPGEALAAVRAGFPGWQA
jgi:uncharacterized iron-regulated membrane protein